MRTSALYRSLLAGFLCFSATVVDATDVSISASKDNTLLEDAAGTLSNGAGSHFFAGRVGVGGGGDIRRGLVAFDIAGAVPNGATITAATLQLTMSKTLAGTAGVSLHRATADWGEGASNAPGEEGAGTAAAANDATWTKRFFGTALDWTTPGGDFSPTASATTSISGPAAYTWSSATLLGDVQAWYTTPATNFGWVVIGDESSDSTAKRFDSRENAITQNRPVLTVTYTVPSAVSDWQLFY